MASICTPFFIKRFFFYLFCWRAPFFLWKCLCFKIQNWLILLERVCETASNHILVFFPKICDAYRPGSAFGRKRYVHGCSSCCGTDLCNSNCMLLYYTSFDLNKKKTIKKQANNIHLYFFYSRHNVNTPKIKQMFLHGKSCNCYSFNIWYCKSYIHKV